MNNEITNHVKEQKGEQKRGITKTFVTVIPLQPVREKLDEKTKQPVLDEKGEPIMVPSLRKVKYISPESDILQYDKEISFPILCAINAYAEAGEEIRILAVYKKDNPAVEYNYDHFFLPQLDEICEAKNLTYQIELVLIEKEQGIREMDYLYNQLISRIEEYTKLYLCVTYGVKSIPIIMFSVANYAHLAKHASLEAIVYGEVNWNTGQTEIHDLTEMFYANALYQRMSFLGVENPIESLQEETE